MSLRIAAAKPFYWIGTVFVIAADAIDPRSEGPSA